MVSGFDYSSTNKKMSLNDSVNNTLIFKKKSSRIDWRKIASVDLDRIARDLDVHTLQENIDHITYCNIESELDTRSIDPNYIKLFKISQYTIEYLVHTQNYLTDVISSIEHQLNTSLSHNEELKKAHDKIAKDLHDVKRENKKRKKMIETQQTLMSVTSANYHQCAYCSKVFLNASYLQAHVTRRHADADHSPMSKQAIEFEKELERIKERLRITESELVMERTSRLNLKQFDTNNNNNNNNNADLNGVIRKIEELKNNEIQKQKEDFDRMRRNLKKEISELNDKNAKFESEIKSLQESLGKKSSIGWIKDDVDLQKDSVLDMKKEIDRLKEIISNYEKEIKSLNEQKSKLKTKENELKRKHKNDIKEKDDEMDRLKAKLSELENSIGKGDNELRARISELQNELQLELQMRQKIELELKNRPPSVTPRQQGTTSASQILTQIPQPIQTDKLPAQPVKSTSIYLPDYCPLTLKELNSNRLHLDKFKKLAVSLLEKELDEFGIGLKDTRLSTQDFKLKMNSIKSIRPERADDMLKFNELRSVFNEISAKHAGQRLKSSMRSSKVHFKPEVKLEDDESTWVHDSIINKKNDSETEEDVSLPEAFESDEDTEPTKSIVLRQRGSVSPRKALRLSSSNNFDETSELENVSQLTDSTKYKKNKSPGKKLLSSQAKSSVSELTKKLEKQLEVSMKKGSKPNTHAVAIGFKENSDENSLGSVSDLDESKSPRPRSGMRASFQDSYSSGLWVPESQSIDINQHVIERPPTANSTKTLNDTDDITNVD